MIMGDSPVTDNFNEFFVSIFGEVSKESNYTINIFDVIIIN